MFVIELLTLILQTNLSAIFMSVNIHVAYHRLMYLYSRKRSRAYTEVHVLQESPLKELQAGKLT